MNYIQPFFNNNYMNELQTMKDRIENQMRQIQQPVQQQPTNLTQNFQLAPQTNLSDFEGRYIKDIEEVKKTLIFKDTCFLDSDKNTLWFKSANGDVKTYKLEEIIELDEKDKEIIDLKNQLEELKEVINAKSNVKYDDEYVTKQKPTSSNATKTSSK